MAKNTREHILEVSLMLFLKKGFKGVTMKDIVDKTGLSKGAFYHYFESKKKVFEEVVKHFYLDMIVQEFDGYSHESLKAFYEDIIDDMAKIFAIFQKKKSTSKMDNAINHYQLLFDAMHLNPYFKEMKEKQDEKELDSWKEIIKKARKNKEIKTDASDEDVAKMFICSGDGLGMRRIFNNDINSGSEIHRELKRIWDALYQMLKA